jgi:hypothetical protein
MSVSTGAIALHDNSDVTWLQDHVGKLIPLQGLPAAVRKLNSLLSSVAKVPIPNGKVVIERNLFVRTDT